MDNIQEFIKYYVNEKYCIKGRALLDQGYSDLNPDETYLIHSDGKLFTLKEFIEMKLDELNQSITFVKGQNGQMMPSDSNYAGFVQYFEEFAYEKRLHSPELELYNASVGGAQINGFENLSLEDEAKNLSPINFNLDFILVDAISKFSDPVKNHSGLIISRLKELVADIEKFKPMAEDGYYKSLHLTSELDKPNLEVALIKTLSDFMMDYYFHLQEFLFDKHQVLTNCVFKELIDLSLLYRDENFKINGVEDLKNIASLSTAFYGGILWKIVQFKYLAETVIYELEKAD